MKNEKSYCMSCTPKETVEIFTGDTDCNFYQIEINGKTKQLIGCSNYKIGQLFDIYQQNGRLIGTAEVKEKYTEVRRLTSYIEK
jgi:hypothetical protein